MTHTERAVVRSFNTSTWTAEVVTCLGSRLYQDVQISSPYCHIEGGAYVGSIPEEGAECFVLWDDREPEKRYISSFIMPSTFSDGYCGGRPKGDEVLPGDVMIRTNSGTTLSVKSDDSIRISCADGLSSRLYDGRTQSITDLSDSYSMTTGGGYVEWRSDSLLPTTSGATDVSLTVAAKKTKMDVSPVFQVEMGGISKTEPFLVFKASIPMLTDLLTKLGVPEAVLDVVSASNPLYEHTVTILGQVIEKCLTKIIQAATISLVPSAAVGFGSVHLGAELAIEPVIKGTTFAEIFMTHTHPGGGVPDPAAIAKVPTSLSYKVFVD